MNTNRSPLIPVTEALTRIQSCIKPIYAANPCSLQNACDRILAQDIHSNMDVPPYNNSAMDGYAVCASDLPSAGEKTLTVVGTSFAGTPYTKSVHAGQAVRIMTGAVMPEGTDTVIMQEEVTVQADSIRIGNAHQKHDNVRFSGEDIAKDAMVLARGRRLNPADLGLLASLGIDIVNVVRRPVVALLSTGNELVLPGHPRSSSQIYDANRYTLHGALTRYGADILDLGIIHDNQQSLRNAFNLAQEKADLIISSGGVSVGEADFVKEILSEVGTVEFWKIAMKPGKPLTFGNLNDRLFFGLPGNPVSAMATYYQFVQPALRILAGEPPTPNFTIQVACEHELKKIPGRTDFQRGILQQDEQGNWRVASTGAQGSHVLSSMSKANCFIVLPADAGDIAAGTLVDVQPFYGLI